MLADTITDTHFAKRDRLSRLLVFMARILNDGCASQIRAIGVDENTALLLESDGTSRVVGEGAVYFLTARQPPQNCAYRAPLTFNAVVVQRAQPGKTFDLKKWSGETETYNRSVEEGIIRASGSPHGIY